MNDVTMTVEQALEALNRRLSDAVVTLSAMSTASTSERDRRRLLAKASGVNLALSYIADAERGVW